MPAACTSRPVAVTMIASTVLADRWNDCYRTFISASCLATPVCTSRPPRAWERVAVPPANASRRSDHKIYKRITARPRVDDKYQATVAELESQGFGERKRARAGFHVSPYGDALFEEREEDEISGQEMLDNARGRLCFCFLTAYLSVLLSSSLLQGPPLLLPVNDMSC